MNDNESIAAKVRSLSEAGFSDSDIDLILTSLVRDKSKGVDVKAHNEKIEETIEFSKKQSIFNLVVIALCGIILFFGFLADSFEGVVFSILSMFFLIIGAGVFSAMKTIPFTLDKVRFFLKK